MKNALQFLEKAGATIVQMGQLATPPTPDAPPAPPQPIPGARITAEGWRQYIDKHPELVAQGLLDLHRSRRGLFAEEGSLCARSAGDLLGVAAASVNAG